MVIFHCLAYRPSVASKSCLSAQSFRGLADSEASLLDARGKGSRLSFCPRAAGVARVVAAQTAGLVHWLVVLFVVI